MADDAQPRPYTTASGSPVTRYRYDLAGNLEAKIDPLGRITSNTYDALGRLWSTTSPDPDQGYRTFNWLETLTKSS